MELELDKRFPHPASYGRASRTCLIFLGAMRDGKTTRPVRLGALARKHHMNERRLRQAAKVLEKAGFLRQIHQSERNLRTASHYIMAMTPEEVGKLAPCKCLQCLRRPAPIASGRHTDRTAYAADKGSGVSSSLNHGGGGEGDSSDDEQQNPHITEQRPPKDQPPTPTRATPIPPSSADTPLPPILTFWVGYLEAQNELPLVGPVRSEIAQAYAEQPHGTVWMIRRAVKEYDWNAIGLVRWRLRHRVHEQAVEPTPLPLTHDDNTTLLCGACEAGMALEYDRVVECSQCDGLGEATWPGEDVRPEDTAEVQRGEIWLERIEPVGELGALLQFGEGA